jgi:hypothetical protein
MVSIMANTAFGSDSWYLWFVPLTKWLTRKEELAMYFGEKITNIRQDTSDNRIIHVFVQLNPLPEYLEWQDRFIDTNHVLNMGIGYTGTVGMNLEKYPHAFIAGETGSGKSNILKCLIYQEKLSLLTNWPNSSKPEIKKPHMFYTTVSKP